MPVEVSPTSPTQAIVEVRLLGSVTQAEFDAAATQIAAALQPWTRVLVDAGSLSNASGVLAMLAKAPCRGDLPEHLRQAAIVGEQSAAVARSWVRLVSPGSAGAQAFTSREAALAWLLAEYQTTTGGS